MATLTRDTTASEDEAIQFATDRYNKLFGANVAPMDFALRGLNDWIALRVQEYRDATKSSSGDIYLKLAPADKATVDAVFVKYDPKPGAPAQETKT